MQNVLMKERLRNLTEQQELLLFEYAENNMKKLKYICNPIIVKIGGISEKDYDDFYDIAIEALLDSCLRYEDDKGCQFKTFLIGNICRKVKSEIRDRNRKKRIPSKLIDSIDNLIFDEGMGLSEVIPSSFDTHKEAFGTDIKEGKIEKYLNRLSIRQKKIVSLLANGYKANEIREILHMTPKEYSQNLFAIQAYENVRELI